MSARRAAQGAGPASVSSAATAEGEPAKPLSTGSTSPPSPYAVQHQNRSGTDSTAEVGAGGAQPDVHLGGVAHGEPLERLSAVPGQRREDLEVAQDGQREREHDGVVELGAGRRDDERALRAVLDAAYRGGEADAVAEVRGHRDGEALVAAGDPVARQRLERGDVVDDPGGEVGGVPGAGDLDAGADRLRDLRTHVEAVDELGDRGAVVAVHPGQGSRRGPHVADRDAVDAAGLADVVAHAGVDEPEAEAVEPGAHRVVAGQHELGAALDDRSVAARAVERLGPHAAADTIAGFEHLHVDTRVDEVDCRRQAGETGPHHRHARHDPCLPDRRRPSGPPMQRGAVPAALGAGSVAP